MQLGSELAIYQLGVAIFSKTYKCLYLVTFEYDLASSTV